MLNLTLPPGSTPTIQPYGRVSGTAVGSPISGTVVSGRSNLFRFDVSALADGDYVVDLASPSGRFLLRILGDVESLAEEWWQLDAADDIAAVAALGSIGTGARTVAITVNLDGDALQGATVRVTKAAETYLTTTNSSGVATFNLDDGAWMLYSPGIDQSWYIRDLVNARMQMTFTPGASASAAVTQIHSVLNVESIVTSAFQSLSSNPSTLDIPAGMHRVVKNTTSGDVRDWVNDGGVMKSSPAYT